MTEGHVGRPVFDSFTNCIHFSFWRQIAITIRLLADIDVVFFADQKNNCYLMVNATCRQPH